MERVGTRVAVRAAEIDDPGSMPASTLDGAN